MRTEAAATRWGTAWSQERIAGAPLFPRALGGVGQHSVESRDGATGGSLGSAMGRKVMGLLEDSTPTLHTQGSIAGCSCGHTADGGSRDWHTYTMYYWHRPEPLSKGENAVFPPLASIGGAGVSQQQCLMQTQQGGAERAAKEQTQQHRGCWSRAV